MKCEQGTRKVATTKISVCCYCPSFTQFCITFVRHFSADDSSVPQFSVCFVVWHFSVHAVLKTQHEVSRLVVNRFLLFATLAFFVNYSRKDLEL